MAQRKQFHVWLGVCGNIALNLLEEGKAAAANDDSEAIAQSHSSCVAHAKRWKHTVSAGKGVKATIK